jgi:hypothetical protein
MDGSCNKHGSEQKCKQHFCKETCGKTNLENPYTDVPCGLVARIPGFHSGGPREVPDIRVSCTKIKEVTGDGENYKIRSFIFRIFQHLTYG